jgi:beta-glucanase (GH16 family)
MFSIAVALTAVLCCLFGGVNGQYRLLHEDNFEQFDVSFWEHEITLGGGGNWEFQMYTNNRSTSFVRDGVLYLRPILTADTIGEANVRNGYRYDAWGSSPANLCTGNAFYGCERTSGAGGNILNPIKSARLRTVKSLNVRYGRVEVRAQIPKGDWIWPAIWMLPESNAYGEWPASGEIDIMESRGNTPYAGYEGRDYVSSTLHWGPHYPQNGYPFTSKSAQIQGGAYSDAFHVYSVDWTPSRITTYVDGQILLDVDTQTESFWNRGGWNGTSYDNPWYGRPNNAPFDQPFYLVMNVAVGGTGGFFPDGYPGKPWSNTSPNAINQFYDARGAWEPTWEMTNSAHPSAMKIDYVRFYCHEGSKDSCPA